MTFDGRPLLIRAMLNDLEKKIIAAIQSDMPICKQPYAELAKGLGITEATFIEILESLNAGGVMRRFGATLRHQKSGFSANAMVAWQVDEKRVAAVGERLARFREVSHCYHRKATKDWPYNLYTMVHAADKDACRRIAQKMAKAAAINTYALLFSQRELKKTSMRYFSPAKDD